jgi:flagella basal body P-ring formation protein FlgA
VAAGTTLSRDDAMLEEVDWAQERDSIMADPADWVGQTSARALSTGQALRQTMVRPAQVFQAGAQVRVQARGPGFTISSAGQALSPGVVGQQARVRIENGRILSGVVLDTRTVQVEL